MSKNRSLQDRKTGGQKQESHNPPPPNKGHEANILVGIFVYTIVGIFLSTPTGIFVGRLSLPPALLLPNFVKNLCEARTKFLVLPQRAQYGGTCARPMRLPDPSPALDKNRAPMAPEILSSTGAGVWRKAPMAFPDSSSVLDLQSATVGTSQGLNEESFAVRCAALTLKFDNKCQVPGPSFSQRRLYAYVSTQYDISRDACTHMCLWKRLRVGSLICHGQISLLWGRPEWAQRPQRGTLKGYRECGKML